MFPEKAGQQNNAQIIHFPNRELSATDLVRMLKPEDKKVIMQTCLPPGSTDSELALYLYRCKQLGLDPLSRELVMQKYKNKNGEETITFITTRDAYLKCAERNPNYLGIISGVVREGDQFSIDAQKGIVHHSFGAKRGRILGAWAIAYHKQRMPVPVFVDFQEYYQANRNKPIWESMPSAMIQKVAEVAALRRQFPILSGVYTYEEMNMPDFKADPSHDDQQVEVHQPKDVTEEGSGAEKTETPQLDQKSESAKDPRRIFKLVNIEAGESKNKTPFLRIYLQNEQYPNVVVYAVGEALEKVERIQGLREGSLVEIDAYTQGNVIMLKDMKVIEL